MKMRFNWSNNELPTEAIAWPYLGLGAVPVVCNFVHLK